MAKNPKADAISAFIEAGFILHPLVGKVPTKKEWQKLKFDIHTAEDFPANYGVVLQSHQLVIDMDPRNYKEGELPWRKLLKECNLDPEIHRRTFFVKTGNKGTHLYFSIPSDVEIMKSLPGFAGLDFLSKGSYVVGPGSIHPDTKALYEIGGGSPKSLAPLPDALLERIKISNAAKAEAIPVKTQIEDESEQALDRYIDFLKTTPAAVQGEHGDRITLQTAMRGRDIGLSDRKTTELMAEFFNPRCSPPWDLGSLRTKVLNAYRYAKEPKGNDSPEGAFTEIIPAGEYELKRKPRGEIKVSLVNAEQFFLNPSSPLFESLIWDDFIGQAVVIKKLPWDVEACPKTGREWNDNDTTLCKGWLSRMPVYGTDFPSFLIYEAMINAAHIQRRHPVREYLEGLSWDRRPRLDSWLVKYAGCTDTPYVRAVGSKVLMAACARIFKPGIKFDHMLILEGDQGIGKSRAVQTLGGQWYGDLTITPHEKDTISAMRSKWIAEVSEMEYNNRTDAAAIKSFMTREADVIRLPYERAVRAIPRQSVLIGTINPEGDGSYLKDQTGNRRFWPVLTRKFDIVGLQEVRDQLFAEAAVRWKGGEHLWLSDLATEKAAKLEQADRTTIDPWTEAITDWLACNEHGSMVIAATGGEIFKRALKGEDRWFQRKESMRISNIMKALGFVRQNFWDKESGQSKKGYVRAEYAGDGEEMDREIKVEAKL